MLTSALFWLQTPLICILFKRASQNIKNEGSIMFRGQFVQKLWQYPILTDFDDAIKVWRHCDTYVPSAVVHCPVRPSPPYRKAATLPLLYLKHIVNTSPWINFSGSQKSHKHWDVNRKNLFINIHYSLIFSATVKHGAYTGFPRLMQRKWPLRFYYFS